jgi:DNA polymerase III subunit delta
MPQLGADQFLDRLAKGKIVPAILLEGSDPYLRDLCRKKIIEAFVPEAARDWAVARLSAEDGLDEILGRAQTLPMLSPLQIILVSELERIEDLGEESREEAANALSAYLDKPASCTVLVLEATALDKRQRLFKVLSEKSLFVRLEVTREDAAALAAQMAKELGVEIDRDAAAMLVDILNAEAARIRVEIEKLALYALDRKRITAQDVEALVVSAKKFSVWQLADMLASRRRDAAMKFLDNLLREGEEPAGIVGALAWMYRKLIEARELPAGTPSFQAARQLSMRSETAELALRQSRKIPQAELLSGIAALAEADSTLKSGVANPRAVMEFLIARLTGAPAQTTTRPATAFSK